MFIAALIGVLVTMSLALIRALKGPTSTIACSPAVSPALSI